MHNVCRCESKDPNDVDKFMLCPKSMKQLIKAAISQTLMPKTLDTTATEHQKFTNSLLKKLKIEGKLWIFAAAAAAVSGGLLNFALR